MTNKNRKTQNNETIKEYEQQITQTLKIRYITQIKNINTKIVF